MYIYRKNAAATATTPTRMPELRMELADPANGVTVGVETGTVPFVPFVGVPEARTKLAHVRRVALLLWMTIDLSPKKYGDPGVVDR